MVHGLLWQDGMSRQSWIRDRFQAMARRARRMAREKLNAPISRAPQGKPRGIALVSYLRDPILTGTTNPMPGHSNRWECREICRIFLEMGYAVDVIDHGDAAFFPQKNYNVFFDIDTNLQRLAPFVGADCLRLMHLTTSYPRFSNAAEMQRVAEFEARTGRLYSPKRILPRLELTDRSLRLAHRCSLIGNATTLETYPPEFRDKITCVSVSGSFLPKLRDVVATGEARDFVWFSGYGAVHKGLDLVLEVFSKRPDLTLHVIGDIHREPDFTQAYATHLAAANVIQHGYLDTSSPALGAALENAAYSIYPSCAEGTATAMVTCLQFGLLPIMSRSSGVDLPDGCGIMLEVLTPEAVAAAVDRVTKMSSDEVMRQTLACQMYALKRYSRPRFSFEMRAYLSDAIADAHAVQGS